VIGLAIRNRAIFQGVFQHLLKLKDCSCSRIVLLYIGL
jgi:hypothetical protein